jgi:predicted metal-dependent peptidase
MVAPQSQVCICRCVYAKRYQSSSVKESSDCPMDTSGSIGQRELTAFLSEVKAVARDMVRPRAHTPIVLGHRDGAGMNRIRYYRDCLP